MKQKFLTVDDVREKLQREIKGAGNAQNWASQHDFSKTFVSYVVNGKRPPSKRMADYLGFREVKVYAAKEEDNV